MNRRILLYTLFVSLIVIISSESWSQWAQTSESSKSVACLTTNGSGLFAGTYTAGILESTDDGNTWTPVNAGLTDTVVYSLVVHKSDLYAGTLSGGAYYSTNNGTSWTLLDTVFQGKQVRAFAFHDSAILVGTLHGVFRSTNNGLTWVEKDSGLTSHGIPVLQVYSFLTDSTVARGFTILAGTEDGVFATTNAGDNWYPSNTGMSFSSVIDLSMIRLSADSSIYLAATGSSSTYRSLDFGLTWVDGGNGMGSASCFAVSGRNVFAGSVLGGVYLLDSTFQNWSGADSGLLAFDAVNALTVENGYLFAGTSSGVWMRPLLEMVTSVKVVDGMLPGRFSLGQNYPNPFNPITTIHFELPKATQVHLEIYNMLGQSVMKLLDEKRQAGVYDVPIKAGSLSSGVYFYRLTAGDFVQTKKMVLMK